MNKIEIATLGGGCFWCVEAIFSQLAGVDSVISGYSNGTRGILRHRGIHVNRVIQLMSDKFRSINTIYGFRSA